MATSSRVWLVLKRHSHARSNIHVQHKNVPGSAQLQLQLQQQHLLQQLRQIALPSSFSLALTLAGANAAQQLKSGLKLKLSLASGAREFPFISACFIVSAA